MGCMCSNNKRYAFPSRVRLNKESFVVEYKCLLCSGTFKERKNLVV
jgi:hypothetical protein